MKDYIRQCWAEAVHLYNAGKLSPHADPAVLDAIREYQNSAMEDDYRIGMIRNYLDTQKPNIGDYTCVAEVWECALDMDWLTRRPERAESIDISKIIQAVPGWKVMNDSKYYKKYGMQKSFIKVENAIQMAESDLPF